MLALGASALALPTVVPAVRDDASDIRDAFFESAATCLHGYRGYIVHLAESSPEPEMYLNMLRERGHEDDIFHHSYEEVFRGVAAFLHESSLEQVFADEHVSAVDADCVIQLPDMLDKKLLGPRALFPKHTELADKVAKQDVDALALKPVNSESMIKSGVEYRSKVSPYGRHWNWGIDRIDGKEDDEYDFGKATGKGTVLYTIDTGVFIDHEEFEKEKGRIIGGWSVGCPTGQEEDCGTRWLHQGHLTHQILETSSFRSMNGEVCEGHGTHTASTAAGKLYGVAKEAEIVVVQGLDCNGTASDSMFIAALDWAVAHAKTHGKPSVMSMSLGGKVNRALNMAAKRAIEAGYTVVAASGNNGDDSCKMSPGAQPGTISVAASDDEDTLAGYSNHGKCTTVVAPGSQIVAAWTTGPTDATSMSGTSMATPHVAGAVLQLLGKFPDFKPEDVRRALACMAEEGTVHDNGMMDEFGGTPNRFLRTGKRLDTPESVELIMQQKAKEGEEVSTEQLTHAVKCHRRGTDDDGGAVGDAAAARQAAMALSTLKSAAAAVLMPEAAAELEDLATETDNFVSKTMMKSS